MSLKEGNSLTTPTNDEQNTQTENQFSPLMNNESTIPTKSKYKRNARGVLAMVSGKPVNFSSYDETENAKSNAILSKNVRRRRRRRDNNAPSEELGLHASEVTKNFNHEASEFTLFYFGAPYCPHSLQFTPVLANFMHDANSVKSVDSSDADDATATLQCICILDSTSDTNNAKFCRGCGFHFLQSDFEDVGSIRAILSISMIPTVFVVNNKTGRVITDWARTAIEFNAEGAVEAWRAGKDGVPISRKVCTIS
mmetsp:Transcript_48537/g.71990  ORF Transcript_48537/g.71990 Transcript_48537/m.71990 type:complete len:253 (-) Transcript_48537:34-792(-)